MKTIARMILPLLLLAGPISADPPEIPPKTVRIGIFPMEPILFLDENGTAAGFIPDLMRSIFPERDGWNTVFVNGSWEENHRRLQKGSVDLMPCTTWTETRTETMDFSQEIAFESWGQLSVPRHSNIDRWKHLQGKTVAVMAKDINGQNFQKAADMLGFSYSVEAYPTHQAAFEAVQSGRADNHIEVL